MKTSINEDLVVKPFVKWYRGLLSGSYATRNNRWQIDATEQLNGPGQFSAEHPIIDPGKPFGEHFDASMVWGPITGRMIYMGLRFSIEREKTPPGVFLFPGVHVFPFQAWVLKARLP